MRRPSKVTAALAVAILLGLLVVATSFGAFRQLEEAAAQRQHTRLVIDSADDLMSALKDAETGQRGFVITGDERFLEPYAAVRNGIATQVSALHALTRIPQAREHLDAARPLVDAKMAELAAVVELRRRGETALVLERMRDGRGRRLMDSIRVELQSFNRIEQAALVVHEAQFKENLRNLFYVISGASALMLLLSLLFGYMIRREGLHQRESAVHRETENSLALQAQSNRLLQGANASLRESEQKLAVTLSSIGDGVIATGADGRVSLLNPVAEKLTGWTQAEALGLPIDDVFTIINQATRQPAKNPVGAALKHGTMQALANHTVLVSRDGSERAIADSCAPIRYRDEAVAGAVLVFRDVTADYFAQQSIRDSAALTETVFNAVDDGIITVRDGDGGIAMANAAAEKIFGYAAGELAGTGIGALIPELGRHAGYAAGLEQGDGAQVAGPAAVRELEGRRKDGGAIAIELAVSALWQGEKRYFAVVVRDVSVRRRAEEARLESGALQSAIFKSANFSSIATDAQGVIQIFNVGAERMLGYKASEVKNRITPADISDPGELVARAGELSTELSESITPGFEALVFKASRGIEDIYELTYIRKDGSRFPAVVSVTALRDDQEKIIGYLLIGTDNSARKRAEAELLKAGALQTAIFNSANFSSIATDAAGVIQIFNVGAERMLGYAAADVVNKITPADISDPQEVVARARALSSELATPITPGFEALVFKASRGIEDIYELTYIRNDGSRFPAVVSVTALRDATGDIIGYLLIGTDNTARKQIEEEQKKLDQRLRDQQFYTRSLIESNIDALMTTDAAGIISDVNKQMESLTECTRDELIGSPFKGYFTDPERAGEGIKLVLSEKKVTNYELTVRARDGRETVVSFNATTFYDRNRMLQGVFAAARDVTERKLMDRVLQETNVALEGAKAAAEKANRAKSEFLSSMSHELRSPLNGILGFAQLMESDTPAPTAAQKESLTQILQSGWHLLTLINEILDLAKIESGQVPMSKEPVSLAEVLLECQGMMEPLAQQRSITLALPVFDSPAFVMADRTRVKQVLINLLSNAVKYNVRGGRIVVACAERAPGRIRTSIADTGEGLSAAELVQLFQPFNRLGQEGGGEEGTGIGLVVAKRLVELMGGSIGVESTPGKGTVFWFELASAIEPHLAAEGAELVRTTDTASPKARSHTLLYVEDNPANRRLVEKIVARQPGMVLTTAASGELGIALARAEQPDVILMDINLPGISGVRALEILRADPLTAHIPVIAVSANAMPRDIEMGLQAGFTSYITKPINVSEFMVSLDAALALSDAKSALRPVLPTAAPGASARVGPA